MGSAMSCLAITSLAVMLMEITRYFLPTRILKWSVNETVVLCCHFEMHLIVGRALVQIRNVEEKADRD